MTTFAEQHRIDTVYGTPGFIKEADFTEDTSGLPNHLFADEMGRRFPCHTKSACYLSNAEFWEEGVQDENSNVEIGERLLKFAEYWDIQTEINDNILTKVAQDAVIGTFESLPDSSFALVETAPTGDTVRLYPVTDSDTVKFASQQLIDDISNLPLSWRKQAATNLLEKAAQLEVQLDSAESDYLHRAAGRGISSAETLSSELMKRAYLLRAIQKSSDSLELSKVANQIKSQKSSHSLCEKVAEIMDTVDRDLGLTQYYGQSINSPENSCHALLFKHAQEELDKYVQLSTGVTYKKEDIEKVASNSTLELGAGETCQLDELYKTAADLSYEEATQVQTALFAHKVEPTEIGFDVSLLS